MSASVFRKAHILLLVERANKHMEGITLNGRPARPGWLWTLRISTIIAMLPMLVGAALVDSDYIPRALPYVKQPETYIGLALVSLMSTCGVFPYASVLWYTRSGPSVRTSQELSTATG